MLRGWRPIAVLVLALVGAIFVSVAQQSAPVEPAARAAPQSNKKTPASPPRRPASAPLTPHVFPVGRGLPGGKLALELSGGATLALERREDPLSPYRLNSRSLAGMEHFDMLKLKAVPKARYDASMGAVVDEKFGYVIYAGDSRSRFDLKLGDSLPVVAKRSNGVLGVVTGVIMVTLRDAELAPSLAKAYALTLKYLDKDLRLGYFSAPAQAELDQVVEALKRDASVENVNLEIVQAKKKF